MLKVLSILVVLILLSDLGVMLTRARPLAPAPGVSMPRITEDDPPNDAFFLQVLPGEDELVCGPAYPGMPPCPTLPRQTLPYGTNLTPSAPRATGTRCESGRNEGGT